MRTITVVAIAAIVFASVSVFVLQPTPLLIWNASASAPRGLYRKSTSGDLTMGRWVLLHAPGWAEILADARRYQPSNVPLIKRIAAQGGDIVCRHNFTVTRNSRVIAVALGRDSQGRSLPRWSGCVRLAEDQLFVINETPQSFDSRYFGLVPIGRLTRMERLL